MDNGHVYDQLVRRAGFRGLWRSRLLNTDGTIEEGWSVTFVHGGEYVEMVYEPTPVEAARKALAFLDANDRAEFDRRVEMDRLIEEAEHLKEQMCKPCGTVLGNLPAQFGQLYKFMQAVQEGTADTDAANTWEEWAKDLQARFGLVYRDRQEATDASRD